MRTFSVITGSRFKDKNTGLSVIVKDVFFDCNGKVHGFLAKRHQWTRCRFYPAGGSDSDTEQRSHDAAVNHLWTVCHKPRHVLGQSVTNQFDLDALITDVYFTDDLDRIVAVETTEGFFSDMRHGRTALYENAPCEINGESFFGQ
ncbi:hypothetical protein ACFQPF_13795 [Fictibacillus iocasae]|uniref:Uncharacterized protein n=1 Tax=Fictibacillus iocasae TaxID=2715437 RepID=A0ABW2NSC9_9BACL